MRTDDLNSSRGSDEPDVGAALRQQLQSLPCRAEPPFGFEELQRRARAAGRMGAERHHSPRQSPLWLAAAAVALVAVGLGLHHRWSSQPGPVVATAPGPVSAAPRTHSDAERYLRQRPSRALVQADSQLAVMALEDRIAVVDDQLNAARLREPRAQQVAVLLRDRAQLVESLAQVRYAQDLADLP